MAKAKKEAVDFVIPSNPADRSKISDAIYEMVGAARDAKDKRTYINDTKKMLKDNYGLPASLASKMIKTVQEQNFQDTIAESEVFAETYELLFERGGSTPAPKSSADDE